MIFKIFSFIFPLFTIVFFSTACNSDRKTEVQISQQRGGGQRPPVRSEAFIVGTSTLLDNIEIPGTIVANEATEIHSEVAGRITGIFFREGSYVSRGALLFKLNDADLQAQRRKLQAQLQIAKQNENRSSELLKIGGISRQDYENTALQVNSLNADIAIINSEIAKTNIRAPYSGKVGFRLVSAGAFVTNQTPLTTISQTSQLKVDFTVPEQYTGRIKNGQYINFRVDGNSRNYTARITATESNIAADTRTLRVRATVQGEQTGLIPGHFATVILNFEPNPNAIMIPTQAVIPQARGKKVYVYKGGVAKFVDITTGIRDSTNVQVLTGLQPGDTILLTGLLALRPEAKVMIAKVVNGTPGQIKPVADTSIKR
ncbi:MAG TPA: efflux RND transporter periplasmic adaptor subunit [Flavisolibacter sp.]|nr:efflux RND transporter periplasmic adaptor subunit [Flavisolibacter sp.]